MPTAELLPSISPPPRDLRPAPVLEAETAEQAVTLREVLSLLRRRWGIVLAMVVLCTGLAAYMALKSPARYRVSATVRLRDERRAMTGGIDDQALERLTGSMTDPVLSQIEVLKSRTLIGKVVDSEGLRLTTRDIPQPGRVITGVSIASPDATDTVSLAFGPREVVARGEGPPQRAPYGTPLNVEGTQFTVARNPDVPEGKLIVVRRSAAVDATLHDLQVGPRERTDVVDLRYESSDPVRAERVLNALVEGFQSFNAEQAQQQSRRRRVFVEEQLKLTDSLLTSAQSSLSDFRRQQQAYSTSAKFSTEQSGLLTLESRAEEMDGERRKYETLLANLGRGGRAEVAVSALASSPDVAANPALVQLYSQLLRYQAARDSSTSGSWAAAGNSPEVQRLNALIASTRASLADALRGQVAELVARRSALEGLRTRVAARMQALPPVAAQEERLTQQVQTVQAVSDQLRQELQKARIAEAVEAGQVTILDRAEPSHDPLPRYRLLRVLIGIALGLVLGGAGAFVLEHLDRSVRGRQQLENLLPVPVLAVVPQVGARRVRGQPAGTGAEAKVPVRSALATTGHALSPGAEAYRTLRTNLIFSRSLHGTRSLLVTSGAPGEGKTTSAANLAVVFAQHGLRVLLVDCDLRRPSLHQLFNVTVEPGFSQVVLGYKTLQESVRETSVPGLSLLPAGVSPPNPADLLGSERTSEVLRGLRAEYDLMVIDTPPVLLASDASILAAGADGVILVVRAGYTQQPAARSAFQQLASVGASVMGTVLNDPDAVVPGYEGYSSGYYTGYYNAYYGGSDSRD